MIEILEMSSLIPMRVTFKEDNEEKKVAVFIDFAHEEILPVVFTEVDTLTGPLADAIKEIVRGKKKMIASRTEVPNVQEANEKRIKVLQKGQDAGAYKIKN